MKGGTVQLGQIFDKVIDKIEEISQNTTEKEFFTIMLSGVVTIICGVAFPVTTITVAGFVIGLALTGKLQA